jgi:folate receptor
MASFKSLSLLVRLMAIQSPLATATPACKRFDEIYPSGKELCENMWDDAFSYETNETNAYTMWFFDAQNPNDATAKRLGKLNSSGHDTCHLNYFHKDTPGPEPENFTECHPWKSNACCSHQTVMTADKLKKGYGKEYHWDRCGTLSPECERFFVQEACFYECDPNAGLYRKWHPSVYNASNTNHNEWQMFKMPIKASYCDAWFMACQKDKFCASGGGSYFSCAAEYQQVDATAQLAADLKIAQEKAAAAEKAKQDAELAAAAAEKAKQEAKKDDDGISTTAIVIGFIVAGVFILALIVCGSILIIKEKAGKPLFGSLLNSPGPSGGQTIGSGQL